MNGSKTARYYIFVYYQCKQLLNWSEILSFQDVLSKSSVMQLKPRRTKLTIVDKWKWNEGEQDL